MRRDFTYIDDIVAGVLAITDGPPSGKPPYRVHNIGNHRSEPLMRFIGLIEESLGKKAEIEFQPMQPGDVKETYADITPIQEEFGFQPATSIDQGIPRFVEWYRSYYGQ
jgi:UDP-glucuronate 4-epimerase